MKVQKQLAVEWYISGMNEDITVHIHDKKYELSSDDFYSECFNQVHEQQGEYKVSK